MNALFLLLSLGALTWNVNAPGPVTLEDASVRLACVAVLGFTMVKYVHQGLSKMFGVDD